MSDEEEKEFEPGFWDVSMLPGHQQYMVAIVNIAQAKHDPESTLMVQLTHRELATLVFGNLVLFRLFPELKGVISDVNQKLEELTTAQDFLGDAREQGE